MACSHRRQNILFFRCALLDNELISNVKRKHNPKIEFCSTDSILECRKRVSLALEQTDYASEADDQDMRPKRKLKYDFYASTHTHTHTHTHDMIMFYIPAGHIIFCVCFCITT